MRIWDIPCKDLCRQHLLGEHRELHAIFSYITKGNGGSYQKHPETLRWKGKTVALWHRHQEQVREMEARGYSHNSPLNLLCGQATGDGNQNEFVQTPEEQIQILKDKKCNCKI